MTPYRTNTITYITEFTLIAPVTSINEANDYLSSDDMTKYLISDSTIPKSLTQKIKYIEWHLESINSGSISLQTTEELSIDELNTISQWVIGQNSDGLGAGWIDQPFANYTNSAGVEVIADFNWKNNKFIFWRAK